MVIIALTRIRRRIDIISYSMGLDTPSLRAVFATSFCVVFLFFLLSLLLLPFSSVFFSFCLGAFLSAINLLLLVRAVKMLFKENSKTSIVSLVAFMNMRIILFVGVLFLLSFYFFLSLSALVLGIIVPHASIVVYLVYTYLSKIPFTKDS